MTTEAVIVVAISIVIIAVIAIVIIRDRKQSPQPFKPEDFIEVERPTEPLRPDAPLARVFQISDDDLPDPFMYLPRDGGMQNYYMTIVSEYGLTWKHPFIPAMKPTQWVRIVAPDDAAARKIAAHFSGGHYATVMGHEDFRKIREFFPHGEYECLSTENYWKFLDSEVI